MEIGDRIAEGGLPQAQEPLHIPALDDAGIGIDVDGEIEEVRYERDRLAVTRQACGLQHVQPFDDEDVGTVYHDALARRHVVEGVRVDRCLHLRPPRLHIPQEFE